MPLENSGGVQLRSFDIEVVRVAYGVNTIRVMAASQAEAEQKALDEAGNHLFTEKSSNYELA